MNSNEKLPKTIKNKEKNLKWTDFWKNGNNNLVYMAHGKDNITFHIMHPPLTRTESASPLPVPEEFKALPEKVGYGLAKHINSRRFIICHSFNQKIQTMGCYLLPIKMGNLLSKLTANFTETNDL